MASTVDVSFLLPDRILEGLASGEFERIGGVIRRTDTKQVVAWLKEGAPVKEAARTAGSGLLVAGQVLSLAADIAIAIKLHEIAELGRMTLAAVMHNTRLLNEIQFEQERIKADPILAGCECVAQASLSNEPRALLLHARERLTEGNMAIRGWLLQHRGPALLEHHESVEWLTQAWAAGSVLHAEVHHRLGEPASLTERPILQAAGDFGEIGKRLAAVKPASRLPTMREVNGLRRRKDLVHMLRGGTEAMLMAPAVQQLVRSTQPRELVDGRDHVVGYLYAAEAAA